MILKILFAFIISILIIPSVVSAACGLNEVIQLKYDGVNTTLTNYNVLINVTKDGDNMTDDAAGNTWINDLYFENVTDATPISFWNMTQTSTYADIWLKIPRISNTANTSVRMYFNCTTSSTPSGKNTFLLFDDFDQGALNSSLWTATSFNGNAPTFSGSVMTLYTSESEMWRTSSIYSSGFSRTLTQGLRTMVQMKVQDANELYGWLMLTANVDSDSDHYNISTGFNKSDTTIGLWKNTTGELFSEAKTQASSQNWNIFEMRANSTKAELRLNNTYKGSGLHDNPTSTTRYVRISEKNNLHPRYLNVHWVAAGEWVDKDLYYSFGAVNGTASGGSGGISTCGTTHNISTLTINFYNETSDFGKVNATLYANMNYNATHSYNFSIINETAHLCIGDSTSSYTMDGVFQYQSNVSGDYRIRDYHFYDLVLDNTKTTLNLYQIDTSISSLVSLEVLDQYSTPQSGVVVELQRYYPELNAYKTVAAPKTDDYGQTSTYLDMYDIFYRFVLKKDGVTLDTKSPMKITTDSLNLFISPSSVMKYPIYWNKINGNVTWSNTTGVLTATYSDTSGYVTNFEYLVEKAGALEHSVICHNISTNIVGSLGCEIGSLSSGTYRYSLWANLNTGTGDKFFIFKDEVNLAEGEGKLFGNCKLASDFIACKEGLFITLLMVLVCAFLGVWSPAASVLLAVVGIAITSGIGLNAISTQQSIALIFIAVILIWRMRM